MNLKNGIVAEKGGRERSFSKIAWDLLPNHKNGWKLVPGKSTEQPKDYPKEEVEESTDKFVPAESIDIKHTKDFKVKDLPELFKAVETVDEIKLMLEGDPRKSAEKFAELRIQELNK